MPGPLPYDFRFESSKHNPIFEHRNHNQLLEIETILSNLRTQLHMVYVKEDQKAFNDVYRRVVKAGEGLEMLEPRYVHPILCKGGGWLSRSGVKR